MSESNQLTSTGTFEATVTKAEIGESKNGTPYVQISYKTASGYITGWMYLSEKTEKRTMDTLVKVFEFDGDFLNMEQLNGKECAIVVEEEEDDKGQARMRVRWVNSRKEKLPEQERKSLAERLSAKFAKAKEEQDEKDGEIPF